MRQAVIGRSRRTSAARRRSARPAPAAPRPARTALGEARDERVLGGTAARRSRSRPRRAGRRRRRSACRCPDGPWCRRGCATWPPACSIGKPIASGSLKSGSPASQTVPPPVTCDDPLAGGLRGRPAAVGIDRAAACASRATSSSPAIPMPTASDRGEGRGPAASRATPSRRARTGGRAGIASSEDHDRVEEGVVVVVREAGDDALERRRHERERDRAEAEDPGEPAQAGGLGAAHPEVAERDDPERDRDHDAGQLRHVRHEADERPAHDAEERERERAERVAERGRCRSARYASTARVSEKPFCSSWTINGRNSRPTISSPREQARARRRGPGAARASPSAEHRDEEDDPEHVQLRHRAGGRDRERPPARPAARPRLPRGREGEHGEEPDRVRVPDEVDSSIAAGETARSVPATRPATGPATRPPIDRASHHVSATAAIPRSAMNAVTATGSPLEMAAAGASRK